MKTNWNHKSICRWFAMLICVASAFSLAAATNSNAEVPELPAITMKSQWIEANITAPEAVKIESPRGLTKSMTGTKVNMYFRIQANGRVTDITHNASHFKSDEVQLGAEMRRVLEDWKFNPSVSRTNGAPVAVKVAMPVVVMGDKRNNNSNSLTISGLLNDLTLVAVLDR